MAADIAGRRILVFCDYYSRESTGGAERVAREVNVRLAHLGAEVTVVSAVDQPVFADPGVRVVALPAYDLTHVLGAQLAVSPAYGRRAGDVARDLRPDLILAHSLHFQGSVVAASVARRRRTPLVSVAHVGEIGHLRGLTRALAEAHERSIGRWILANSAHTVAVSGTVRDHCLARGVGRGSVSVVRNGVDHERFAPVAEPAVVPLRILFVGRLIVNKGPSLLVDAVRALCNRGVECVATFVGDGPLRSQIEEHSAGLPIVFAGARSDVPTWMQEAHVVVRPSYTEGLPLTVLEAMAARRCVVVSDIAANREVVQHGVNGLVHRCGDPLALADALERLALDPGLRRSLASSGHRSAEALTWDACADGYADVLVTAMGTRLRAPGPPRFRRATAGPAPVSAVDPAR